MAYTFRYQLDKAPTALNDGSGMVGHSITAKAYDNGDGVTVPGHHKTFNLPAADLQTVMDMPHSNASEKQAKNQAYKSLLAANVNTQNVPVTGWSIADLTLQMENNDAAQAVAVEANEYITVTLGQEYPVEFNL